ncbi:zinc finger protein 664-like isoform X2 [Hyperolius riggenbachi]|uniref:zinc finger protein 664-like isoform X2 n=1 Tax=Hyperolius riggenbachi TaxID=752182 RepID=UPI0035A2B602
MAGASHCIIQDDSSSDSDVCWIGPADFQHLPSFKSEDILAVYSPRSSFNGTIHSDEMGTDSMLFEDISPVDSHSHSLQSSPGHRPVEGKRGRRPYKPRTSDRISPEKSITRERSTVDSSGNITLMTETVYKCNKCDKTFFTRSGYRKHQKNHADDDRNICGECGEAFADQASFNLHKETHLKDKPWICSVCPKRFRLQSHLAKHERTHTGQRPYICKVCGNSFSQSSNLATHMKTHFGGKSYRSREVDHSFMHDSQVVALETTPTGKRTYPYSKRGRGLGRSSPLASHRTTYSVKQERGDAGQMSFPCGGCGQDFSNCDSYISHSCVLIS